MKSPIKVIRHTSSATRNSCRVCAPLGSSLVFLGLEGCMPVVHGSQGCSTYIRRYMIGHFREPVDIASTNFTEHSAVFGGGANFHAGVDNLIRQYAPKAIGVSTSCLAETMGEDVPTLIREWNSKAANATDNPVLLHVSTPSYKGSHRDGFFDAVLAVVKQLAGPRTAEKPTHRINLFAGFVSPEDLRHLREIVESYGLQVTMFPDYSQTLDDGQWDSWQAMPNGGTKIEALRQCANADATIEFQLASGTQTAGQWLQAERGVPCHTLPLPLGVEAADAFHAVLSEISGTPTPEKWQGERARLLDAYVDAHKYAWGKRVITYGDEELTVAMARFLCEIGMVPALVATGGNPERVRNGLEGVQCPSEICVLGAGDFEDILAFAREANPTMMVGASKGYSVARELNIPLVRVGFPISDRIGGSRMLHVGYRGTQSLFDLVVNTTIAYQQDTSPVGYKNF